MGPYVLIKLIIKYLVDYCAKIPLPAINSVCNEVDFRKSCAVVLHRHVRKQRQPRFLHHSALAYALFDFGSKIGSTISVSAKKR